MPKKYLRFYIKTFKLVALFCERINELLKHASVSKQLSDDDKSSGYNNFLNRKMSD